MGKHSPEEYEDSSDDKINSSEKESGEDSSEDELKQKKRSKKSKHSHKKKKSKDKKHKKKSKKHRKRETSSSEGSEDSGPDEDEWVVKRPETTSQPITIPSGDAVEDKNVEDRTSKKSKLDDDKPTPMASAGDEDEWMGFSSSLATATFSNDSKKAERRRQKEQEREAQSIDKLGQSVNELNPYWKDGGKGLPSVETQAKPKESQLIGDGGLNYLRKAFIRAKEQAKEEGRTLEEVVSERWGSLETFLSMLEEAEKKAEQLTVRSSSSRDDDRRRFKRPNRDSDDEDGSHKRSHSDYSSSSRHHHHRSRHDKDREGRRRRSRSRSRERDRDRDRDSRSSGWRKQRDSPERSSASKRARSPDSSKRNRSPSEPSRIKQYDDNKGHSSSSTEIERIKERPPSSPQEMEVTEANEKMEKEEEKLLPKILTDKEMNELNAKLMKAEMLGNVSLEEELKQKIALAEAARQDFIKNGGDIKNPVGQQTKVVTKVVMESSRGAGGGRRKDKLTETHKDGQRVRYFPDDDRQTLQNMFQKEKMNTAADENALFARLAGKGAKTGQDYDIDDVFTDKASSSKQSSKEQEREIKDVFEQEKQYKKILDNCAWCFEGSVLEKHLIMSIAEKCYLCVPPYQSLTEGHCLIVPMSHVSSATELDEDVWAEMQKFRKALVRMFQDSDQDMVIFETALSLKRHPHMYLECVPMPKETGELAPIYFKKAIQECETEWSQNKKLVELRNRDVRRAIPKGLPYFSVDFGDDSCGFAHVVEDERNFPRNFAHEIVGGMMELDHHLWRKQKKDDFKTQRNKVMEFLKQWAPFDWTRDAN